MVHGDLTKFKDNSISQEIFIVTEEKHLVELENYLRMRNKEIDSRGKFFGMGRTSQIDIWAVTSFGCTKFLRAFVMGLGRLHVFNDNTFGESDIRTWIMNYDASASERLREISFERFNPNDYDEESLGELLYYAQKCEYFEISEVLSDNPIALRGLEHVKEIAAEHVKEVVGANETIGGTGKIVGTEETYNSDNSRVKELELSLENSKKEVEDLQKQVETLEISLSAKQTLIEQAESSVADVKNELYIKTAEYNKDAELLRQQIDQLKAERVSIETGIETEKVETAKAQLEAAKAEVSVLKDAINGFKMNKTYLESQNLALKAENAEMLGRLKLTREELEKKISKADELRGKIESLQQELAEAVNPKNGGEDSRDPSQSMGMLDSVRMQLRAYEEVIAALNKKYVDAEVSKETLETATGGGTEVHLPIIDNGSFLGTAKIALLREIGSVTCMEDVISYLNAFLHFSLDKSGKCGLVLVLDPLTNPAHRVLYEEHMFCVNESPKAIKGSAYTALVTNEVSMLQIKNRFRIEQYDYIVVVDRYCRETPVMVRDNISEFIITSMRPVLDMVLEYAGNMKAGDNIEERKGVFGLKFGKGEKHKSSNAPVILATFETTECDYSVVIPDNYYKCNMKARLGTLSSLSSFEAFCKDILFVID